MLRIDYWSDVLCIWAWVTQARLDELQEKLGDQVFVKHHFIDVFGDSVGKFDTQWADKGGMHGYRAHLDDVVAPYDLTLNEATWRDVVPCSSLNAHLVLKAVQNTAGENEIRTALDAMRKSFFVKASNVSDFDSLLSIVEDVDVDIKEIRANISSGAAAASLMADYKESDALHLRGSPSFVLDGGRQTLFGNVSFSVLNANVEGLLESSAGASWC